MKRVALSLILSFGISGLMQGKEQLVISNRSDRLRSDHPFVVKSSQLTAPSKGLLPALKGTNGGWVPTQVDDLDGDGHWDELVFVYTIAPRQVETLSVIWLSPKVYPLFTSRTHVRFGKLDANNQIQYLRTDVALPENLPRRGKTEPYPYLTDGPAWENDKIAFRHYFDGRNSRDIFGKLTDRMVMDSVGILPDGLTGDTYHVMNWWGRDIMSGRGFGLGGLALQFPDTVVRLGVPGEVTTNNVDSTRYTCIADGPIRAVFRLDFYGWAVCGSKIDLHETTTIWPGKYGFENSIRTSELPKGACLVTGIVNDLNDQPYLFERAGRYQLMATHDRQTYKKEWVMGMGLLIDRSNWCGTTFESPRSGHASITHSWNAALKPDSNNEYRFNAYAVWEIADSQFSDRICFLELLRNYADELTRPVLLRVVRP